MIDDLELFSTKLGKLEGFSDAGDYLIGLVRAKHVETPKAAPAKVSKEDEPKAQDSSEDGEDKDEKALAEGENKSEDKNAKEKKSEST